jgi:hypothetical protein
VVLAHPPVLVIEDVAGSRVTSALAWSASAPRGTPTRADRREVKAFLRRSSAERSAPLFVFGAAGYDPVEVQRGPEGNPCRILVRPRAGRCFHADPSLAGSPAPTGRPRRHGLKMNCADPSTWPKPSTQCTRARTPGANLHPKARTHARRSSRGPLPTAWSGRWFWRRWSGCPAARGGESRASCGCGGIAPKGRRRTWACCGAPTSNV